MAAYGTRTTQPSSTTPESLSHEHASTRLNLTHSHTQPTYATGFGNKTAKSPAEAEASRDDEAVRLSTQDRHGSAPYTNAHTYGSGSTAGAGWGNKTGGFSEDSTLGKVMERVGGMVHRTGLVDRGGAAAEEEGHVAN